MKKYRQGWQVTIGEKFGIFPTSNPARIHAKVVTYGGSNNDWFRKIALVWIFVSIRVLVRVLVPN